jgi:hypothetical protein
MLQIWDVNWFLDVDQCPCDVHFVEWLDENKVKGKTIFHFGTGGHHHIGLANFAKGTPNDIVGITASPKEFEDFVKLAIEHAELSRHYQVLFGDIYLLNPKLLPRFDVVTLFHLCEFRGDSQDKYGGLTDAQVFDVSLSMMPKGGFIQTFTGSFAGDKATAIAMDAVKAGKVERLPDYKSLQIYRKV